MDKIQPPINDELLANLDKISYLLDKNYLYDLKDAYIAVNFDLYNQNPSSSNVPYPPMKIGYDSNIRAIKLNRWVYDKEESIRDRFKNILNIFAGSDSNLGMVIKRTSKGTDMYFVVKNETNTTSRLEDSNNNICLVEKAIKGNFNGTSAEEPMTPIDAGIFWENAKSIAVLTNISSEKSEDFISQGIEKLLDGIVPYTDDESYSILVLAEPIDYIKLNNIQSGYEELASAIAPFAGYQYSIGDNSTETSGEFESASRSHSINRSITKTNGINVGLAGIIPVGPGVFGAFGYSHSRSKTEGTGESDTDTQGKTYNLSIGKTKNTIYTYKSFAIGNLIEKLQAQLNRANEGRSLGMWKCASYVLAKDAKTTINVASFLRSLTQGDESYIEPPVINEWTYTYLSSDFDNIKKYIDHFTHPIFANRNDLVANSNIIEEDKVSLVTATCNVSTTELADIMAFPRNSILGLPVIGCVRFGRDVISLDRKYQGNIDIGCSYHMHQEEIGKRIMLDKQSLTAHTFITGSTGAGKSNTIYQLLDKLCPAPSEGTETSETHFLAIEPAKGEYKTVFGGRVDVSVFGTNPNKAPLLRINPFSFPEDIHVLEHIDRLVEIFNACWPMYAAMPAILKEAIENAYRNVGWSLSKSICIPRCFPTFENLIDELPKVISSSSYSPDTKGDYTGALITRIKSLTNGINGQVFCSVTEIPSEVLFDGNVIIDLSRVGSSETKALLMGIMIMKLQEYRMSSPEMNSELKHITVLEEAHNLLRRTSMEQTQESSNLQGKSVEMLANAIAEMRTYGEGFIIADQSPGLLDMSVIRNTNTKIIMRLPDESDRVLVGKAAGLNDNQISEIARLKLGVAAIYQNNWIEPVLCAIDKFNDDKPLVYDDNNDDSLSTLKQMLLGNILELSENYEFTEEEIEKLKLWMEMLNVGYNTKTLLAKALYHSEFTPEEREIVFYNLFNAKDLAMRFMQQNEESGFSELDRQIAEKHGLNNALIIERIRDIILHSIINMTESQRLADKLMRLAPEWGSVR